MKKLFKGYRVIAWCMVLVMLFSDAMPNVLAAGTVSSGDISSGDSSPKVISENTLNNVEADASDDAASYYSVGGTLVDAAIFCSDVHGSTSDASSVFSGIKTSGLTYSTASFAGDTFTDTNSSKSTVTSAVQSALGDTNIECLYIWGDHDSKSDIEDYTGLVYGDEEGENYYVYALSMYSVDEKSDASEVATDLTTFTETVSTLDTTKPMFIVSHLPLHVRRGDNIYASDWYEVISDAAEKMDIVFFWAHNHTGETSADTDAYYVEKDGSETMTIQGGSTVTPNFTYMNAGYINANNQNPARKGVATTVALYEDCMVFQDYNSSGTYTGTYAHNVTVDFEFADLSEEETITLSSIAVTTQPDKVEYTVGETLDTTGMIVTATYSDGSSVEVTDYKVSEVDMTAAGEKTVTVTYGEQTATFTITVKEAATESTVNTVTYSDTLLSIQATALGLTGIDAVNMWGEPDLSTYFYDYVTYDMTLEGHTEGNEVTYSMLVVDGMDTTNLQLYYIADDGSLKPIEFTLKEGYIEFTTTKVGTFAYGAAVINATLTGIEVTTLPEKLVYWVDEALDGTDLVVTASYDNGATRKLDWNEFDETIDGYALSFTTAVAGTQTVTVSYGGFEDTFEIEVYDKKVTEDTTGITVEMEVPGVTEVTADISINEKVDAAVVNVMKEGTYVAYDIELVGYNNSETVTVTLPIPEGVLNPIVYYVSDDGATVTDMNATVNEDGTTVSFVTNHFSTYVVGEDLEIETENVGARVEGSGTTSNVWMLTDTLSDKETYLIVNTNTAGSGYALLNNNGSVGYVDVTVIIDTNGTYIDISNDGAVWTAETSNSNWTFKNGSYYLSSTDDLSNHTLSLGSSKEWNFNDNTLSYTWNSYWTRYLTYASGWTLSRSSANVYFYTPATITTGTVSGTYTVEGTDVEDIAIADKEVTLTHTLYWTPDGGEKEEVSFTGATVTYEVVTTKGNLNVIKAINDSTAILSGTAGTAVVKVTYSYGGHVATDEFLVVATTPVYDLAIVAPESTTVKIGASQTLTASATLNDSNIEDATIKWTSSNETIATVDESTGVVTGVASGTVAITATYTDPNGTVHTDTVDLEIVDAVYELDLCKPVTTENEDGTTTTTYESVTAPIVVKDVAQGTTTYLWAVITADGVDIGELNEEQLAKFTWYSSDESIATVDKTTGAITFQGGEGTVTVTAMYEYADGKFVTDTVIYSVSADHYYVPADGTDDFPEYPNEGAIRFDKTATAVGNFSQTGIAKVELSMTGVPYTTGSEIDVMVMLDMTGSMSDNGMKAAEEATKAFVKTIVINEDGTYNDNRVAVYAFNSGSSSPYELVALDTITSDDELTAANTAIGTASNNQASGGTPFDEAAETCYNVLQAAKTDGIGNDRQQFCVFMSDGGPTTYYGSDKKTYYGGNNNSGDVLLTSCMTGYKSSSSADWKFTLPTEYYTNLMKADGVTVYTVGLLLQTAPSNPAPYSSMTNSTYDSNTDSLTTIGSHYYFTSSILKQMATDESKYIDIFNVDNADKATAAFTNIAKQILDAAKDVKVTDKITDEYTMVFEAPNETVADADGGQEYYIEVIDYALTPVYDTEGTTITDYKRGTATSLMKVYLAMDNGVYYAASDSTGTKHDTPTFAETAVGTKYYWATDSSKGDCGISVVGADGTTYYFVSTGEGTHNMTSGAYASGTLTTETIRDADTGTTTESSTSQNVIIATPYFVYNASTRMLIWTAEKLNSSELALSYFLYLDNSGGYSGSNEEIEAGTYETNEYANITYTNFNGNECEQIFPVPQMTWNGAQVSYVFYLVNEQGQPVNRAGRVVPFSEAVYVTDVYTYSIVWNDLEQLASLEAEYLAQDLVPDVYELYDSGATYNIHVFEDENAVNLNNHFVIGTDKSNHTTYVFNTKSDAIKYTVPGTYAASTEYLCKDYNVSGDSDANYSYTGNNQYMVGDEYVYKTDDNGVYTIVQKTDAKTVHTGFDFSNTTVAFAVVWKPELVEDTIVIDYGLDVVIDVATNDALASGVVGVRTDAPSGVNINKGQYTSAKILTTDIKIGELNVATATVESLTSVRFALDKDNGMQLSEPVKFYYESDVNYYVDTTLTSTSMYSSVTVIPATTVYYEDSYVDLEVYTDAYDALIWTDTEGDGKDTAERVWEVDGTIVNGVQDTDRPGVSKISEAYDADNVYGYDSAYSSMSVYSMGSARKLTVDADYFGKVKFSFYGTGFDVISMTSNQTGTIVVQVADAEGNVVRNKIVDTYYGYELNADGDWVVSENNPNALYQVPVISVEGLDYGKYSVTITVAYNDFFAHNGSTSYDFYLDAIRIYDPTGVASGTVTNETVENAYQADGEGWPSYVELRDNIIAASNFSVTENVDGTVTIEGDNLAGAIFIDSSNGTVVIADYVNYGPNNELYLASGQSIAFTIDTTLLDYIADVQLGIKVGNGGSVNYKINDDEFTVNSATDMYYSIKDYISGTITITNNSDAILSLTNIKVTYTQNPASIPSTTSLLWMDGESATWAVMSLRNTESESEEIIPEETTPETETEESDPEQDITESEVANNIKNVINKITYFIGSLLSKWFR